MEKESGKDVKNIFIYNELIDSTKASTILTSIFIILIILLVIPSIVLASWFEDIKEGIEDIRAGITGKVTDTVSVNITVGVPEIRQVYNNTSPSITSAASGLSAGPLNTSIIINFSVYLGSGSGNINNGSATINFSKSGETTRQNASCNQFQSNGVDTVNYTCNVTMMWFDRSGTWSIQAFINDTSGNAGNNKTTNFSVGETIGVDIGGLSFPELAPGTTNQTSNLGLLLNNTGNKNITTNATQINATNLRGETTNTLAVWAGNMSVSWNSSVDSCHSSGGNGTKANNLSAGNYVNVTIANLSRGNFLTNDNVTGQERLYFCIKVVGIDLTSQSYSTLNESAWTVQVLLLPLVIPFGRRIKRKLNKLYKYKRRLPYNE